MLDQVFTQVTDDQIEAFQIKTGKQRMDSTQIASNIRQMGRLQLLATVTPEGLPHITLLSSLKAAGERTLTCGQFTEGISFYDVEQNPKIGWLVMTLAKDLWRGSGNFTHTATSGAHFDAYNNIPMFRYNAYFGIHTAYYMDLVAHIGGQPLPEPPVKIYPPVPLEPVRKF